MLDGDGLKCNTRKRSQTRKKEHMPCQSSTWSPKVGSTRPGCDKSGQWLSLAKLCPTLYATPSHFLPWSSLLPQPPVWGHCSHNEAVPQTSWVHSCPRAFALIAPTPWNAAPSNRCLASFFTCFKSQLQFHFLNKGYPEHLCNTATSAFHHHYA